MRRPAVLYVSYDGMLEPLGQSQVITYLERLSDEFAVHLISYEKPADRDDAPRREAIAARLGRAGIVWHPLTYHKHPTVPATLFDLGQGLVVALSLAARHHVRIVHARSYIPALIGWIVKRLTGAKLLFDMRGLWPDERIDGGIWSRESRVYRAVKRLEQTLLLGADHIVTLTHASKREIERFPYLASTSHAPISVIPTCADLDRFSPADARALGSPKAPFTLGYLGSIGTWYLFDEVLACFALIRAHRPDARMLVVNRNEQDLARTKLAAHGIDPALVEIVAAEHGQVPGLVRRMTAGTAINRAAYSQIANAPTKLAEYLGCGVPCLGSNSTGDIGAILEDNRVGVALMGLTDAARRDAVDRLLALCDDPDLPARCRTTALRLFSADKGAAAYRAIYRELLA